MQYICDANDIPDGSARSFYVAEQSLIVVKSEMRCYVYRNRCPHLGIGLEWIADDFMDIGGDLLRCATHGALFLPDSGECVAGPCAGDYLKAVNFISAAGKLYLTETLDDDCPP